MRISNHGPEVFSSYASQITNLDVIWRTHGPKYRISNRDSRCASRITIQNTHFAVVWKQSKIMYIYTIKWEMCDQYWKNVFSSLFKSIVHICKTWGIGIWVLVESFSISRLQCVSSQSVALCMLFQCILRLSGIALRPVLRYLTIHKTCEHGFEPG